MRLLVFIPNLTEGGAQRQCARLVNELGSRDGVEVVLVWRPGVGRESGLDHSKINARPLPAELSYKDPRTILAVRRIIKDTRPDVVMTWLRPADVFGWAAKAFLGIPWVIGERNSAHDHDLVSVVRRRVGRRANLVMAISRGGVDYWRAAGRPAGLPSLVVDNIVVEPPRSVPVARDTIAFIGRLEHQKNVHVVARGLLLSATERPDVRHLVVGQGSLARAVAAILTDSPVQLMGFVNDTHSILARSLALLLVSHYEGLPNVALEAISHGVPVVASDLPEFHDLLGPDYPYYVTDRASAEEIARVVRRVVDAPDPRALDFARARIRVMTAANVADSYLNALADHTRSSR